MKKILLCCPMSREADMLRSLLGERPGLEVEASGIGIQRSLPWLLRRFRNQPPDLLIFSGSVTGLNPVRRFCEVCTPTRWILEPGGPSFSCSIPSVPAVPPESPTTALSLSRPVMRPEQREALFAETGAEVYDSVTAAVVRVAGTSKIPCITPKIVANTVDSGLMTFWGRLDRNLAPLVGRLNELLGELDDL